MLSYLNYIRVSLSDDFRKGIFMRKNLKVLLITSFLFLLALFPVHAEDYDFSGTVGSGNTEVCGHRTKDNTYAFTNIFWNESSSYVTMHFYEKSLDWSTTMAYCAASGPYALFTVYTSCINGNSVNLVASQGGILKPGVYIGGNWEP